MFNQREMNGLLQEASALNEKPNWTKQDERRNAFLLSAISAVKAGASLQDVNQEYLNDVEQRNGLPITQFEKSTMTREQRAQAQVFRHFVNGERRDIEGSPMLSHIGTYSGLGYFVPTGFFAGVFESAKAYDFLLNEDDVTLIRTSNGRVMTVPTMSDTEHDASVIAEAGSQTSVDIADPNQAVLGVYSYASRRWPVSLEAFQDLEGTFSAMSLFQRFTAKALARGIGRDLAVGNGINKTLGLVPALLAAGVAPVVASGSSVNDGSTNTGANSVSSQDLANALSALNPAYIGPKTAFGMNNSTLNTLRGLVSKFGSPLDIVRDTPDGPTIYGIPVKIAPSLDNIGPSQNPIVLGDFEYWATRLVTADDAMGIKAYKEAPGLIENGLVGFRSFVRAGGSLLWQDINSPCPFVILANHS
jgi:HK97 family phage major capsid protein